MYTYFHNNYLYSLVEMQRFALEPYRQVAKKNKDFFNKYYSQSKYGRTISASLELFERVTRNYEKPEFGITETVVNGKKVKVKQQKILSNTFCDLLHFEKDVKSNLPKMLVVAPLSGHYATLLRGTVKGLLPHFDVYITDWVNARDVSVEEGYFTFDDFVRYTINYMRKLGPNLNVMAVCQPSVPVSAAVAMMSKANDECVPDSMILMGGPIDTRQNPTEVNDYAADRTIRWFESNVITKVPVNYAGAGRSVYPGFMQLYGFMAMNLQTHMEAHWDFFNHLVEGDGDSAESHKRFYNEYLSVMDMPAEFYLETVNLVFKKHLLPRGKLVIDGEQINLADVKKTSLLCIEGEKDDISGRGQTKAAIDLCTSIPASRKKYHLQKDVGHYGIFNGRRYREHIVPTIVDFVYKNSSVKTPSLPKAVVSSKAQESVAQPSTAKKTASTVKKSEPKAVTKTTTVKKSTTKAATTASSKAVTTKTKSKTEVKPAPKTVAKPSTTSSSKAKTSLKSSTPKKEVKKAESKTVAKKAPEKPASSKPASPKKPTTQAKSVTVPKTTKTVKASEEKKAPKSPTKKSESKRSIPTPVKKPEIVSKNESPNVVSINQAVKMSEASKPTPVNGKTGGTKK